MTDTQKKAQLSRHKALATGLFILMAIIFIATTWYLRHGAPHGWAYVKAFSEAAMVGALADWFAVTALFHKPLGLPIPHTNLIENSKKRIGSNLGDFVVNNFLTAENLRPYINKLSISPYVAEWLSSEKNKKLLLHELSYILTKIVSQMDDAFISKMIKEKGEQLISELPLETYSANILEFVLKNNEHEALITLLAEKIKDFISENDTLVKERVHAESPFFVPGFVDRKLAAKITSGLIGFFDEIATDSEHRVRQEINAQIVSFTERLHNDVALKEKINSYKKQFLEGDYLKTYVSELWLGLKASLLHGLKDEQSLLRSYFSKNLDELSAAFTSDDMLQQKIDGWIRVNAYKYILKNNTQAGVLISNTVGNWKGRELSQKLELEVGKDLQFIRINGTLVGGLVGLLLYVISLWIG